MFWRWLYFLMRYDHGRFSLFSFFFFCFEASLAQTPVLFHSAFVFVIL